MAEVSSQLKSLTKKHDDVEISTIEVYEFGKGKQTQLLVPSPFVKRYFGISEATFTNWKKLGMKKSDYSLPKLGLFDLQSCLEWKALSIDTDNNKKGTKGQPKIGADGQTDYSDVPTKDLPEHEAERRTKITKMESEEVKLQELKGSLIRADDVDKAMADQAVIYESQYYDDLETLPQLLQNKTEAEIDGILTSHYEKRMKDVFLFVNKEYDMDAILAKKILNFIEEEAESG